MKKQAAASLLIAACMFLSGIVGFFLGRNTSTSPIIVQHNKPASSMNPTSQDADLYPININTADVQQLQKLPGIGPVLAQRIVDYREKNGLFRSVSELTLVEGIGLNTLEEILDYVTTGGSQ